MEKGLKNLTQASRSAQKKQGIYGQEDSGIGGSDEEQDIGEIHDSETYSYSTFPAQQQQRVPSIQSMLGGPMTGMLPQGPPRHGQ